MDRARAVVIGGGITGCSILLHLAEAGWTDVLLLEKGELTSGSTCHAAGLVTMFNPSPTMMRFRRYSIERYRALGVFEAVGGLRFASSRNQLMELQRGVSRAERDRPGRGALSRCRGPGADARGRAGRAVRGCVPPDDGFLDPHGATHALAAAARSLGARIETDVRVTGIELSSLAR